MRTMRRLLFVTMTATVLPALSCTGAEGADGTNGADGADGVPGANSLLALEDEAPGENCPYGGTSIHSGVDLDDDGELDAEEIAETDYVCDGAPAGSTSFCPDGKVQGDYTIHNSIDAAIISDCTTIIGNLTVAAPGLTTISLPALESTGNLTISVNDALTMLSLPALASGSSISIGANAALTMLSLPAFTSAGNDLTISPTSAVGGVRSRHSR